MAAANANANASRNNSGNQNAIIGIDLGTTFSCVGVWEKDSVTIISNDSGNRTTPSWVAFTKNGERLVGEAARSQAGKNPTNTFFDVKRLIGRSFDDPFIHMDKEYWPFKLVQIDGNKIGVEVVVDGGERKIMAPEEISAAILAKMKRIAEDYLGVEVKNAVITVPAYFNDSQRQATKNAGAIAGLNVLRIINEPTAAALSYGLDKQENCIILIFDFGGGTLDVSILQLDTCIFEVLSTHGITHLGGEDFDNRLFDHFATQFQKQTGLDVKKSLKSVRKLKDKCQEVKKMLSHALNATIDVEELMDGHDFEATISRGKFEELTIDLMKKTLESVTQALEDAELTKSQIDQVVLVGGSTRIPKMQQLLEEYFDGKKLCKRLNPDEAVAYGAAVLGGNLSMSAQQKQGTKLEGLTLMDVTPLSLGIEMANGSMSVLIKRNTTLPFQQSKIYYNNEDYQTECSIEIFEGERKIAKENRLLGRFVINNLPQRKRGQVKVTVTFNINVNGILDVSAVVDDGGEDCKKSSIVLNRNKGGMDKEEIERLIKESQRYELQDKEKLIKYDFELFINNIKAEIERRMKNKPEKRAVAESSLPSSEWINNANSALLQQKKKELQTLFYGC